MCEPLTQAPHSRQPWLAWTVLGLGLVGAAGLLVAHRLRGSAAAALIAVVAAAALAAPAAWSLATAAAPHSGAIPFAGPQDARGRGGAVLIGPAGARSGAEARSAGPGSSGMGGSPGGAGGPGGGAPPAGAVRGDGVLVSGNLLGAPTPPAAVTALLQQDAQAHTWAAATIGSNSAAAHQLASGEPVMALGGFNGTDPSPALEQFQQLVAEGQVHYFLGGAGRSNTASGGSDAAHRIGLWVEAAFPAATVDGTTVYDLTQAP